MDPLDELAADWGRIGSLEAHPEVDFCSHADAGDAGNGAGVAAGTGLRACYSRSSAQAT